MNYSELIDPSLSNTAVRFAVGPYKSARVQVTVKSGGSATGAVYVVEHSLDGISWLPFPKPCTLFLSGISRLLNLEGIPHIRVRVATADGSTGQVQVSIFCQYSAPTPATAA